MTCIIERNKDFLLTSEQLTHCLEIIGPLVSYTKRVLGENRWERDHLYTQEKEGLVIRNGLIPLVYDKLHNQGIPVKYLNTTGRAKISKGDLFFSEENPLRKIMKDKAYPLICNYPYGIFHIFTGVGKTRLLAHIAVTLYKKTGKRVLWVSSKEKAVYKGPTELLEMISKEAGMPEEKEWLLRKTRKSLRTLLDSSSLNSEVFSGLLIDEVQDAASEEYKIIFDNLNFERCYGFTGSLVRSDNSVPYIVANCGPVIFHLSKEEAHALGYIMNPQVVKHTYYHKNIELGEDNKYYHIVSPSKKIEISKVGDNEFNSDIDPIRVNQYITKNFIIENRDRAKFCASLVAHVIRSSGSCILLYDNKKYEHGNLLISELDKLGYSEFCAHLTGTTPKKIGDRILDDVIRGKILILITTVGYRSLDLPCATDVFLLGGRTSEELVLQGAGRLTRHIPTWVGKKTCHMHIIEDMGYPMLEKKAAKAIDNLKRWGYVEITPQQWKLSCLQKD